MAANFKNHPPRYHTLEEYFALPSVNCQLALSDIYDGIIFNTRSLPNGESQSEMLRRRIHRERGHPRFYW